MIYNTNIRKVVNKFEKALETIVDEKLMIEIGSTIQANTLERVHEDGLDSNLQNIGQYDTTTPIYINPDKAPRKTASKAKGIEGLKRAGKYGDTKFKNGKPHKTAYNANYKALRNKIGRRIDKVDLNFSGKLSKEFQEAKPFRHCIIDNFFEDITALDLSNEFPDYNDPNIWSVYRNAIENKKLTPHWDLFPAKTYQAFTLMNTPGFVESVRLITGIPDLVADYGMHGGGWHMHSRGGKLNMHKDYSIHPKLGMERRINIIIYMTPDWKE